MTVLEAALEALRQYQQSKEWEDSGDLNGTSRLACERSEISEERSVELVEVACRCSARPYPHIHSPEDQRRAVAAWNRDSTHKIEPIQ